MLMLIQLFTHNNMYCCFVDAHSKCIEIFHAGLIKRLLSNSTHAEFLVQADHVANEKKGLNLALLLKRVLLPYLTILVCIA